MSERLGSSRRHPPRGFLGMIEASKPLSDEAARPTRQEQDQATHVAQILRLIRLRRNFNAEVKKMGPERAKQHAE